MSEKLVLLKPRGLRLAEMFVGSIPTLAVGPSMRAVLRDSNVELTILPGLIVACVLAVAISRLTSYWGAHHGGDWVTQAERMHRLLEEAQTSAGLVNALAYFVQMATI